MRTTLDRGRNLTEGKMKKVNRVLSYFVVFCVFMQACLLISCGGSGGGNGPLTTARASREVARATTQPQIHMAFDDIVKVSGFNGPVGNGSNAVYHLDPNVQTAFEQADASETVADFETVSDLYTAINNDPDFAVVKLGLSVTDVVAGINSKLPAAYANPNTPVNATLVLMSSRPGNIPSVAPTLTADTLLSPVQQLMFAKYIGTLGATRSICTVGCYVAYAAEIAAIVAAKGFCLKNKVNPFVCNILAGLARVAAKASLNACLATCHDQGGIVIAH